MLKITIIGSLMLLMMAAKKNKPVFGQMTLSATKALEYVKTSEKPFTRRISKIVWIQKHEAQKDDWDVPDWVMESPKYNWCAIIIDVAQEILPLFVYQKSALQGIEAKLMQMEAAGAEIKQVNARRMDIDLGDGEQFVSLWRNPKGGKFAQYHVGWEETEK